MGACCFKPTSQTSEEHEVVQADNNNSSDGGRRPHRTNRPTGEGDPPVLVAGVDGRSGPGPGNKLLCRKPPVWNADHPMTRGQLLSKRDEFWDTAPAFNGKPEIWQALRAAAECEDTETAQAIMAAVNVTLPHGNLSVVYDELGNKYDIPPYCLSEPTNMVKDESSESLPAVNETAEKTSEESQELAEMSIRLRLSTGAELEWSGLSNVTIGELKTFVEAKENLAPARQRCFFGGQLLTDAHTLQKAKIPSESVVQIMVRPDDV
mmetsp:Transcript_16177/g.54179  ORF Transcript_16177/g.54179 Transcript_16177/m.54179 type:complete len:264 (-) Transcript_16177:127-918(-)